MKQLVGNEKGVIQDFDRITQRLDETLSDLQKGLGTSEEIHRLQTIIHSVEYLSLDIENRLKNKKN